MQNTKTQRLVTTAIMLALASVLSMVKVLQMPLGGSITLLSMLPIVLLSIKYGVRWGLFSAFAYALVQFAMDVSKISSWGYTTQMLIGSIIFDYLLAFTILGVAGIFRNKGLVGFEIGIGLALFGRFVCHFISGSIFLGTFAGEGWNIYAWSFAYNGLFMLPEMVITMIGAFAIFRVPVIKRLMAPANV